MKRSVALAALLGVMLIGGCARAVSHPRALAFTGVTVVDVRDGRLYPDRAVLIEGSRIRAVDTMGVVRLGPSTRVIDAHGKYLIPGFWDMEFYVDGYNNVSVMKQLLATGVTGYRNLGQTGGGLLGRTTIDSLLARRRAIKAGRWVGPRILIGGPRVEGCVNGEPPAKLRSNQADISVCATTPARARLLVDSLQAAGADHIFWYDISPMSQEVMYAILAEARRRNIPVVGHLPRLSHDTLKPTALLAELSDSGLRATDHWEGASICLPSQDQELGQPRGTQCAELAARLRRNNTWIAMGPFVGEFNGQITPPDVHHYAQYCARSRQPDCWPDSLRAPRRTGRGGLPDDFFATIDRAGLPILIATDGASNQPTVALRALVGIGIHNALVVAVEHGLSPLTALQAVTLNPAKYLNGADSLGTVEAGKVADVLLLDGNPLADIYNTRAIRAVVADGRYFDRAALDTLLQQAGAASDSE